MVVVSDSDVEDHAKNKPKLTLQIKQSRRFFPPFDILSGQMPHIS